MILKIIKHFEYMT